MTTRQSPLCSAPGDEENQKCPICSYRVVELPVTKDQYDEIFKHDYDEDDVSWNGKCILCHRDVTYSPVIVGETD